MRTAVAISILLTLTLFSGLLAAAEVPESADLLRSAFKTHCLKCHGPESSVEGDINLAAFKSDVELQAQPELLEKLIAVLNDREMPPEGEPSLPDETRLKMLAQLRTMFAHSLKTQPFKPVPIRRMNRFQYNNAVVDLLELDRDIFQLNERLLRRRDDYLRPATGKMPDQVRVSIRPLAKDIDNERPEGFRGVAPFPQDKRAEHGFDNRADHLTLSPLLMESFLTLSQTIAESPDINPRECRSWDRLFAPPGKPVRGSAAGRYEAELKSSFSFVTPASGRAATQEMQGFGSEWSGNAQLFWQCREQGSELELSFEAADPGSGLRLALTKARDYGKFDIFLDGTKIGPTVDLYDPRVTLRKHDIPDLKVALGSHTLTFKCVGKNAMSTNYFFGLDYLEVTGRKTARIEKPDEVSDTDTEVIRQRLEKLLRRAFRRPVVPETLDRFTKFAEGQLESGASFEDTMRTIVGAVIGMPEFLYLYESSDASDPTLDRLGRQRVNDFELATRLAQFFWSSIPDDELLDLAEASRLSEPETLSTQIDRMLNDQRSSRFCDNFPGQWLQLDRLITSIPDQSEFPYFYYSGYRTSIHMMSEPLLLFDSIYIEDRSIMDLLDPKFTWQSDMLQANYEGHSRANQQVQVQIFKRTPLEDPRRGGVITNAAVMTMTSTPTRTQPITRGAWINEVIFNDPPEPPPADVPPLPEVDKEELISFIKLYPKKLLILSIISFFEYSIVISSPLPTESSSTPFVLPLFIFIDFHN